MRLYFGLTTAALLFAVLCWAPLAWDGSWYLFNILNSQAPYVPFGRVVTIPLHYPVIAASGLTDDLRVLRLVFGLVYAAVPLGSLAASWWTVHRIAPSLFVWPALGIGLGTLPGQLLFASEGIQAVQLSWPILLSVATGIQSRHIAVLVGFGLLVDLAHPVATALLALAAALAFAIGLGAGARRKWIWGWAAGLAAFSVARLAMTGLFLSAYEADVMSLETQRRHFAAAVAGLPLVGIVGAWLAGAVVFSSRAPGEIDADLTPARARGRLALSVAVCCLVAAGGVLLVWAREPARWMGGLDFRSWALVSSLPFMVMACVESVARVRKSAAQEAAVWNGRLAVIQIVAAIFALVLCTQSTAWYNLGTRLRETIAQHPNACISKRAIGWLRSTALSHWATPTYVILLQARKPAMLVLNDDECAEVRSGEALWIKVGPYHSKKGGWFDLSGPFLPTGPP